MALTPEIAQAQLKKALKSLEDRNKKTRNNTDIGLASKVNAALNAMPKIPNPDFATQRKKLKKEIDDLQKAIKEYNEAVKKTKSAAGTAVGAAQDAIKHLGKEKEPDPKVYAVMVPALSALIGMEPEPEGF